jgi:hypothetical protein
MVALAAKVNGRGTRQLPPSPLVGEAWAYWHHIRDGRAVPLRSDFDPCHVPHLLNSTAIVEILFDPLDFRFRLLGTAIDRITSRNLCGLRFSELPFLTPGNKGWQDYEQVARTGVPLMTERAYVGRSQLVLGLTDSLFPLSTDGRTIDRIWSFLDIACLPIQERPRRGGV